MKESMFCPQGERQLAAYLEGRLRQPERLDYESHLATCSLCSEQVELWRELGGLRVPAPSAGFSAGFHRMLDREMAREVSQRPRRAGWAVWAAVAAALALVCGGGGYWMGAREGNTEMARLDGEMRNMRSLMAVSLLQQQSAVERLRGVNYSQGLDGADDHVVDALVDTLRGDSSVDVRLAAADALRKYAGREYAGRARVRAAVADALPVQDSPLLQIALIDTLSEWKEPKAVKSFESLVERPETDEIVKQRLVAALEELKAGGKIR